MTLFLLCTVDVNNSIHFCEKKKLGFVDLRFVKPSDEHIIFLEVELNSRKICEEVYWNSIPTSNWPHDAKLNSHHAVLLFISV